MNLQTFKAPTMAIALQQVKTAMGPDAVILHTRTYQLREWMGLRRRDVVEVTAGRGLGAAGGGARRRQPPPTQSPDDSTAGSILAAKSAKGPGGSVAGLSLYGAQSRPPAARPPAQTPVVAVPPAIPASQPRPVVDPVANGKTFLEMPAAGNALMLSVSNEVAALKQIMTTLVAETRHIAAPQVPDELFDHYLNLIQNQVAEELALDIMKALAKDMRPDQLARPDAVRERLAEHIERLVPACGPIVRKQ